MAERIRVIELHEPQQCCPGGVCSVEALEAIAQVHETLQRFIGEHRGQVTVRRYVFPRSLDNIRDPEAQQRWRTWHEQAQLPVTCLDGEVVKTGDYPSYDELLAFSGLAPA